MRRVISMQHVDAQMIRLPGYILCTSFCGSQPLESPAHAVAEFYFLPCVLDLALHICKNDGNESDSKARDACFCDSLKSASSLLVYSLRSVEVLLAAASAILVLVRIDFVPTSAVSVTAYETYNRYVPKPVSQRPKAYCSRSVASV